MQEYSSAPVIFIHRNITYINYNKNLFSETEIPLMLFNLRHEQGFELFKLAITERNGRVLSNSALDAGGSGFKSWF